MTQISVIIPMFNASPWIRETLKSVISQGMEDIEIIIVDDGSTDGSAELVSAEFPAVNLIRAQHRGASGARNLGTSRAKGEFIQYLDADDLLAENKLKIQLEALKSSGADIAYGDWQRVTVLSDGQYQRGKVSSKRLEDPEIDLFTDFWSPPAAYLFRRSFIEKSVSWNENLIIIQDARFVLDCALRSARFVYAQGLMAYYRERGDSSLSRRDSTAFVRDCLRNAMEIENWWRTHTGINKKRKKALIKVYGYVAREGFVKDLSTFEGAYEAVNKLVPCYMFDKLRVIKFLTGILGHAKAVKIVNFYRKMRL